MRRWLLIALFLSVWLVPWRAAAAQPTVEFESLIVEIWPEYDQPSVLVIYRITLTAQSSLPAQVTMRIPKAAEKPFAVAVENVSGMLEDAPVSKQEIDGDWIKVTFTATAPNLQLEYYDPSIIRTGTRRDFSYTWPADYRVKRFTMRVQQPTGATGLALEPAMTTQTLTDGGFTYQVRDIGSVEPGTPRKLAQISYSKADDTLSSTPQSVQPKQPVSTTSNGSTTINDLTPWLLLGASALLLVGGGVWYYQSNRKPEVKQHVNRRRPSRRTEEVATADGNIYCHQCGRRAGPGDVFCRTCGTRLRTG
jgi:hypothetical protein